MIAEMLETDPISEVVLRELRPLLDKEAGVWKYLRVRPSQQRRGLPNMVNIVCAAVSVPFQPNIFCLERAEVPAR